MFCREIRPLADGGTHPVTAAVAGPGEQQFVTTLKDEKPLEEAGDLALHQPRGQTAMVVAISQSQQRIVGWSFALPTDVGVWSLYHFRPATFDIRPSTSTATDQPEHTP